MTDNLRDRIAAALYRNLRRQQGIDRPDRFLDWIDTRELADAVIESLNLNTPVEYLSVDGKHKNFMVAGNYTVEATDD
jgi:hypothetical protein